MLKLHMVWNECQLFFLWFPCLVGLGSQVQRETVNSLKSLGTTWLICLVNCGPFLKFILKHFYFILSFRIYCKLGEPEKTSESKLNLASISQTKSCCHCSGLPPKATVKQMSVHCSTTAAGRVEQRASGRESQWIIVIVYFIQLPRLIHKKSRKNTKHYQTNGQQHFSEKLYRCWL